MLPSRTARNSDSPRRRRYGDVDGCVGRCSGTERGERLRGGWWAGVLRHRGGRRDRLAHLARSRQRADGDNADRRGGARAHGLHRTSATPCRTCRSPVRPRTRSSMCRGTPGSPRTGPGIGAGSVQLSLRNLGAQRTLVLVDGRRWVAGASASGVPGTVDLNSLPDNVIDRIEILQDGASAVYGSDAIGGVVNVITDAAFAGFEFDAQTGGYLGHNDGESTSIGLKWGVGDGDTHAVLSAGWRDELGIETADRSRSAFPNPNATSCDVPGSYCSSFTPQGRFVFGPKSRRRRQRDSERRRPERRWRQHPGLRSGEPGLRRLPCLHLRRPLQLQRPDVQLSADPQRTHQPVRERTPRDRSLDGTVRHDVLHAPVLGDQGRAGTVVPRGRLRQSHQRQFRDLGDEPLQPVRGRPLGGGGHVGVLRPSSAGIRRPAVLPGHAYVFRHDRHRRRV